jgi:hypothetical protein
MANRNRRDPFDSIITLSEAAELLHTSVQGVRDLLSQHRLVLEPVRVGHARCIPLSSVIQRMERESR